MGLLGRLRGRHGPRWAESWQTFPGSVDEAPGLWHVDLGAVAAAPVGSLPVRMDVRHGYTGGGDGLPVDMVVLHQVADTVRRVADGLGGAYVGFLASANVCRLVAHLPAESAPGAQLAELPAADVGTEYDPHWAYVRDRLAPDERQQQHLADVAVLAGLADSGDTLATARDVEHVAMFAEPDAAERAAQELRRQGFGVTVERDDEGEYVLCAVRTDPVAPPGVHALTWSVREAVERHGGGYDSWRC
jgi:regulator of ribonuclease activity B/uncharacterized protein DUF695